MGQQEQLAFRQAQELRGQQQLQQQQHHHHQQQLQQNQQLQHSQQLQQHQGHQQHQLQQQQLQQQQQQHQQRVRVLYSPSQIGELAPSRAANVADVLHRHQRARSYQGEGRRTVYVCACFRATLFIG